MGCDIIYSSAICCNFFELDVRHFKWSGVAASAEDQRQVEAPEEADAPAWPSTVRLNRLSRLLESELAQHCSMMDWYYLTLAMSWYHSVMISELFDLRKTDQLNVEVML